MATPKGIYVPQVLQVDNLKHITMSGFIILGVFFGGFGIWAAFAQLSGAIVAQGTVKVDLNRKAVQHREGGIIQEILVREGDEVKAGQPLIILSDMQVSASVTMLRTQLASLLARLARLEAQRDSKQEITWPQDLASFGDLPDLSDIKQSEAHIMQEERGALEGQIRLLQEQISGFRAQAQAEERIIAAYQEELTAKQELQRHEYLEKTPVLELQRNLANHQSIKSVAQQKVSETSIRIIEMRRDYIQKATSQYGEVQGKVLEIRERLRPSVDAQSRLAVTAPVAGTVMDMTIFSVGGVVRPGDRLMDVVPREEPLIIEADVQVKDITNVRAGQAARVQLSAYNNHEVTPFDAKVTYVSPDRTVNRTPMGDVPVYKIHAEIPKEELSKQKVEMTAGMPAVVFVTTKKRTMLDYLIEPLTENFRHALRE